MPLVLARWSLVRVVQVQHPAGVIVFGVIVLCSPWAQTPKLGICYHSEGQMLSYIFRILEHCSSFWYVIAIPKE